MPQLYPMNWSFLFLMFMSIMMISLSTTYFSYKLNTIYKTKKKIIFQKNWKW
uniref:ATP synthase subunit 8 n=1 Tax=Otobius megnini TaxID=34606 RepID=W0FIB4_OTOMG|nr:ATP synthase F0 subunit 8 [Otobius megnini]AHF21629.1 ATP synthase subunit 8 [Otobius megnini]AIZ58582.1 ATP synthase F0 subunit 8 [Otobius megnini]UYB78408.1 ATP synthase F0 subunit 8 [Otobius megnini]